MRGSFLSDESFLNDRDLLKIITVLMPDYPDKQKMIRILREDEAFLEGMLADDRFFHYLMDRPETFIQVSLPLFFTVLLIQARKDLTNRAYTMEPGDRRMMIVFDSKEVVALLANRRIRAYLAGMLASFVRFHSYSVSVRVRQGIWRRLRFNDFDIDRLIRYTETLQEDERFPAYKRIADVCLFLTGLFPDYLLPLGLGWEETHPDALAPGEWEKYARQGEYYYREASRQRTAIQGEISDVLQDLSEKFILATKPLSYMSSHYLRSMKQRLFSRKSFE